MPHVSPLLRDMEERDLGHPADPSAPALSVWCGRPRPRSFVSGHLFSRAEPGFFRLSSRAPRADSLCESVREAEGSAVALLIGTGNRGHGFHPFAFSFEKPPRLRVARPCAFCKGGNHEPIPRLRIRNRNPLLPAFLVPTLPNTREEPALSDRALRGSRMGWGTRFIDDAKGHPPRISSVPCIELRAPTVQLRAVPFQVVGSHPSKTAKGPASPAESEEIKSS